MALLIGPATFSAAEDFAATFDYLDVGPIVGMPSGGSSGEFVLERRAGQRFLFTIRRRLACLVYVSKNGYDFDTFRRPVDPGDRSP